MNIDNIKGLIVLIMAVGLMGLLGLIVVDEFMIAAEHNQELDQNIVELLQMSITGIIGLVAGFIGSSKGSSKEGDQ
jgi:di/tricarboxylate transporter